MSRDPRLLGWLRSVLATPGLTALADIEEGWRVLVEDALAALPFLEEGPVVDVGSGGGSPGIPLAVHRPDLQFELLESSRRKCTFLEGAARELSNVTVVCARAEEHGRGAGRDAYAVATARALAPQAVAVEWCLPLLRPGGLLVLYSAQSDVGLARVAGELAAEGPEIVQVPDRQDRLLLLFRKLGPTPARFPRRPGIARKRPLA